MKAYKYIIMCATALVAASCNTEFFESSSPSALTAKDIYTSPDKTEQAIAGIYEIFGEDRGYRNRLTCGYAGLNTDIEYNRKTTKPYATYQILPSNTDLSNAKGNDPWGYLSQIIERCNNVVDGINAYSYVEASHLDSAKFDYMRGEAHFLRAFAMLEMVKYWGDVPVNVKAYDGTSLEEATSEKVDRNVAFEQIRKDLLTAAQLMEWSTTAQLPIARNDVRRPSRAAAYALLARADLMYAGKAVRPTAVSDRSGYAVTYNVNADKRLELYQEVMMACDTILRQTTEMAKFKSTPTQANYEQIFKDVCSDKVLYSDMEQIWVIPLADGARGQVMNYNCAKYSDKNANNPERCTMGVLLHNKEYAKDNVKSNFAMSMVPSLLFAFDENDVRRLATVLPYRWEVQSSIKPYYNQTEAKEALGSNSALKQKCLMHVVNSDPTQWACGKYRLEWMSRDNSGDDDGIDFPVIRMSDVMLMLAEASIGSTDELGAGAVTITPAPLYSGQECYDMVRARAGLTSKTLTLDNIMDERKFEFAGEYIRKWDLMRWGNLRQKMEETWQELQDMAENETRKIYVQYELDPNSTYLQSGAVDYEGNAVVRSYKEVKILLATSAASPYASASSIQYAKKLIASEYQMYDYDHPETLESRQYWPLFNTTLGAANGLLFNNYGY